MLDAKDYSHLPELKLNELSQTETRVIVNKGTERPFSGKYNKNTASGVYTCKRCDAPLYKSDAKFKSSCGWPSFDDEIKGAVKRVPDADGRRVEIVCARCDAHLGHVFKGEGYTPKNIRHCVNSISLNFEKENASSIKKAYFAGGCFWGVEYHFEKLDGVKSVDSGYMGGHIKNPTYRQVTRKKTGHLEVVEVVYNSNKVSYESLVKLFFEIHDPTQKNGQGPDIGSQYLSAIFTSNKKEKEIIYKLVGILNQKGLDIATKIHPLVPFYKAEDYHQDYYANKGKKPYCHSYKKLF
ncbi:MAG: bifunctional methionine sulfoxide reductase B/A protein [Sulfurimonas sp.]|nr:bifunctional methionine sulfoxide reductase B/A protein [Sulfurimonas sp.]MDQ7062112.1 bifunctional methionine sulfoxide reductase B/A protein [Sulfurimonas sp.]